MTHKPRTISPGIEPQLIKGCIAGDRSCQSRLYELYAPAMMIVCMRYAKNREEAEEILQNGFIRVFKFIDQVKQATSLEGWIRKIMVNCALQKFRSQVNLTPVIPIDNRDHDLSYGNDIIEQIQGKELLKLVQNLPPAYRTVFNLYVFEGLKHREIAALLNIAEGTSKSNLYDARQILQQKVAISLKAAK
jgi:RNA polymerase sigma factor (sigma-70 family)